MKSQRTELCTKILTTIIPLDLKAPDKQHFALYIRQFAGLEFGLKMVSTNFRNGNVKTYYETDLAGDELEDLIEDVSAAIYDMAGTVTEYSFC